MRILPLPAQLLPMVGDHRPIVGRLIGRIGPDEENDEREGDAKKREQGEDERRAPAAQQQCERQIGDERADQDDAEQAPAAVGALHDEILLRRLADLVRKAVTMRAAWCQGNGGGVERKELNDLPQNNRPSPQPLLARQPVWLYAVARAPSPWWQPPESTARPASRLFAPPAA